MIPYKDIRVDNYRMPRGVDKANLEVGQADCMRVLPCIPVGNVLIQSLE